MKLSAAAFSWRKFHHHSWDACALYSPVCQYIEPHCLCIPLCESNVIFKLHWTVLSLCWHILTQLSDFSQLHKAWQPNSLTGTWGIKQCQFSALYDEQFILEIKSNCTILRHINVRIIHYPFLWCVTQMKCNLVRGRSNAKIGHIYLRWMNLEKDWNRK